MKIKAKKRAKKPITLELVEDHHPARRRGSKSVSRQLKKKKKRLGDESHPESSRAEEPVKRLNDPKEFDIIDDPYLPSELRREILDERQREQTKIDAKHSMNIPI